MLVKTLVNDIGYNVADAEAVMSIISTWGLKLNMIIISVVTGLMTSLIPNLTSSFVQNDMEEVKNKINKTYQVILILVVPMTVGLSVLAKPVWTIFYGNSVFGPLTYQYMVFVALATAIFTATTTIIQLLKEYKTLYISLILGISIKILFNVPFVYGFSKMGLPAFYGSITATILGFLVPVIICMRSLKTKYKVNFESTLKELVNILIAVIIMTVSLLILKLIVPINTTSRLVAILVTMLYAVIGAFVYIIFTFRLKTINNVFGIKSFKDIFLIFSKKRRKK